MRRRSVCFFFFFLRHVLETTKKIFKALKTRRRSCCIFKETGLGLLQRLTDVPKHGRHVHSETVPSPQIEQLQKKQQKTHY